MMRQICPMACGSKATSPSNGRQRGQGASLKQRDYPHGENKTQRDALVGDVGASPSISPWTVLVQAPRWGWRYRTRSGLAQSLIERNHSTLKGVRVKSIPPGWGGRAGGAGRWPCPSAGSAGRAQAVATGFAAHFSAAERQNETRRPLLCVGQTRRQRRARVGSGSPWQRRCSSSGSCFSVSINQG